MKIIAPAKLNLFLHITGRRNDGYHLLESLFVFTQFGDEITITPATELSLTIDGPFHSALKDELIENNIAYRAALLVKNKYAVDRGAKIMLAKHIPVGAGLGGGSSDAATVLKGLNQLWDLKLSLDTLCEIGLSLGADIPACIVGKPAMVSGVGEIIKPIAIPSALSVLLVNPIISLSTQTVFQTYKNSDAPFSSSMNFNSDYSQQSSLYHFLSHCRNDLEFSAIQLQPEIQSILTLLKQQPQCQLARMSGSGSTCFALFSDPAFAQLTEQVVRKSCPDYWVQLTELKCFT